LAEYARDHAAIRADGARVAALSVDSPARSEGLRNQLALPFPLLCDPARTVVRAWDLYNAREMGGIAVPAVFVIGPDRRVLYRSIDTTSQRVSTAGVLRFLRGDGGAEAIEREAVAAGLREFTRAIVNAIRRGLHTPHD
jgi:peroxiredoxin